MTTATKPHAVRVSRQTHARLLQYGAMADTFDDVINKVLDAYDTCQRAGHRHRRRKAQGNGREADVTSESS